MAKQTYSEDDIAKILGVDPKEVDDFLHQHFSFEQRAPMHDVLSCERCGGGQVSFQ